MKPVAANKGALLLACAVALSCNDGQPPSMRTWTAVHDTVGDTIVVRTLGGSVWQDSTRLVGPEPRIVYRSEELGWPGVIIALDGGRLAVSDRTRIHIITQDGEPLGIIGRAGKGPGEFSLIGGMAAWPGDSLLVWDPNQYRLTWLSVAGRAGRTALVEAPPGLAAGEEIDLVPGPAGVVLVWYPGYVLPDGPPPPYALARHDLDGGLEQELARVPGFAMIGTSMGVFVPRSLYGPRPLYAVALDGRVAVSDGVEYCVLVLQPDGDSGRPLRICRDVERPLVQPEIRAPDYSALADLLSPRDLDLLRSRLLVQEFPERKNAIEELRFDSGGRLWVRRTGADERYDPMLLGPYPELRPEHYDWDVFDRDGRLLTTVALSSRFEPRLILGNRIYGVVTLDTGENVVALVELTDGPF